MTEPAQKKNCLYCPYFTPSSWILGYCNKKKHYVYQHIRFCGPGFQTEYSLEDPARMLEWWTRAAEWATKRADLAQEYYDSVTQEGRPVWFYWDQEPSQ